MFYPRPLFSNPRSVVWLFNSPQHRENCCSYKISAKTGRALQLIYFFKSFRISRISHNYAIPRAMPHAIPQTLSAFYPHRSAQANNLKSTLLSGLKISGIPVKHCPILRLLGGRDRVGQRARSYECKTATPTKTSFENITLFHLCYFTIIQLVQLLHKRQTTLEPEDKKFTVAVCKRSSQNLEFDHFGVVGGLQETTTATPRKRHLKI